MNNGKVGRPFRYAETYIKLLAYIRYLFYHIDRQRDLLEHYHYIQE